MKVKTQDLTGPALDWAVARALGLRPSMFIVQQTNDLARDHRYSRDWAQGGPIIEREKIEAFWNLETEWWSAAAWDDRAQREVIHRDPSLLIAAMRCYVASKLGDTVDIPEELL